MATAVPRKIAILIPTTSRMRPWKTAEDTYLYNYTLKTFKETYNPRHHYYFYIGIDADDAIFSKIEHQRFFAEYVSRELSNTHIAFQVMKNVQKGHLTVMWNQLFETALNDGNDYFYQTGDDIVFKTAGWVDACLGVMERTNDIGMTGPINNNARILTQSFVSRKHHEIFGFYFPPAIINWCCDDWINWVYQPGYWYPIRNHFCLNVGGEPRYIINNDKGFMRDAHQKTQQLRESTMKMALEHRALITRYIAFESGSSGGGGVAAEAAAGAAASSVSAAVRNPVIFRDTFLLDVGRAGAVAGAAAAAAASSEAPSPSPISATHDVILSSSPINAPGTPFPPVLAGTGRPQPQPQPHPRSNHRPGMVLTRRH